MNADGSFVLSLVFFKMVEALRVKEIDQMIESLQKEVKRVEIVNLPLQKPVVFAPKKEVENTLEKEEELVEDGLYEEESLDEEEDALWQDESLHVAVQVDPALELYNTLVETIMDRNIELGECFIRHIRFVSFSDGILTWESCVDEECKKALIHGFSVIKQLVREIFGFETVMKNLACSKVEEKSPPKYEEPEKLDEISQASSMVEESEVGAGSCETSCSQGDSSVKEFDGASILEEPMIQKAMELFEATKITVQSKI
jgi:DNA polymerase-3 subunit gamma/tau